MDEEKNTPSVDEESIREELKTTNDLELAKKYSKEQLIDLIKMFMKLDQIKDEMNKMQLLRYAKEHLGVSYAERDEVKKARQKSIQDYGKKIESLISVEFDFSWVVSYRDGTSLSQYNGDGSENKMDLSRPVKMLSWIPFDVTRRRFDYELDDGEKPIIVRRCYVPMGMSSEQCKRIVYMIGGEKLGNDGKNIKDITYISPSFRIAIRGKDGKHRAMTFPGSVERSGDKGFCTSLDKWCRYIGILR
jgi:hypothetical protein